eukprot:6213874-Pleurochrysis_carterae.AAC.1
MNVSSRAPLVLSAAPSPEGRFEEYSGAADMQWWHSRRGEGAMAVKCTRGGECGKVATPKLPSIKIIAKRATLQRSQDHRTKAMETEKRR